MSLKAQSNLKEYTLVFSGDPALTLPEDPAERERVLAHARETGDWSALVREGETPTGFVVSPMTGTQFDYWMGECARRKLVVPEANVLALRLVLRKVENFGAHKVSHKRHEDGQTLAALDIIDAIYAETGGAGREVIDELANAIVEKAQNPLRPKS